MDYWGSLQSLNRKQQADKRRKAEIRALYTKRRKSLIHNNIAKNEYDFPKLSKTQLEKFKNNIRNEYQRKRIINFVISTILFTVILFSILYILYRGLL